jgi:hypothetical protein
MLLRCSGSRADCLLSRRALTVCCYRGVFNGSCTALTSEIWKFLDWGNVTDPFLPWRLAQTQAGVWRGWNAPNPMIDQSSNLVPAVSAHTVASKTPFGA